MSVNMMAVSCRTIHLPEVPPQFLYRAERRACW